MDIEQFLFSSTAPGVNERLDIFIVSNKPDFSRSRIQGLIKSGQVLVNNEIVQKTGYILHYGDKISLNLPPMIKSRLNPEAIALEIIFENKDLIIINKPAGMVVHPSPGHDRGTLVHALLNHIPNLEGIGGVERPGIVHRLDKDTSGLIIAAKNEKSHIWLQEQFRSRKVEKTYLGLVDGAPPSTQGRIEAPIGRNTTHRKLMAVVSLEKGREAVTEYHVINQFSDHALLEIHPYTGRTHQIRVHLAFLGCPIVGDKVYGKKKTSIDISRQFLHASKIKLTLPGEENPQTFSAELPNELAYILSIVGQRKESQKE